MRLLRTALSRLDAAFNRLYTWRYNPLYHSGALVVASFVVLLLTGIYLLLFYRIGSPYASVDRITAQAWTGRWIRSLHRYSSDLAVLAAVVHAFRMFVQGRSWGPRALAWVSGLSLLFVFFVCGWTGYVMVWDVQAQLLASEGARFLDVLPLFTDPVSRTFVGDRPLPSAFFFLNLFLHIALPIGVALLLWIHVSRVARPGLLPPPKLLWGSMAALVALSVLWPVAMAEEASPFRIPTQVPLDLFYAFWVPLTLRLPGWVVWLGFVGTASILLLIPRLARPEAAEAPLPSVVNERYCTGCNQCADDCPYEAITMVVRPDGRAGLVARVNPALCVSCGICAGSCAPMGVGPPGRTGRDQLAQVRAFIDEGRISAERPVVVGCKHAARPDADALTYPVACTGNLHTSVVELLVRAGAGGVLIVSCPPRDCWNREGAKWLEQRLFHEREAELKDRVDRRRVRLVYAGAAESSSLAGHLARFERDITQLREAEAESAIELDETCDAAAVPGGGSPS